MYPGAAGGLRDEEDDLPKLEALDTITSFPKFIRVLASHINEVVDIPRTFEQLRTEHGMLRSLAAHLFHQGLEHSSVVAALLILKWHYTNDDSEDTDISETRGYACEILAWRYLVHLSEDERMTTLLQDIAALSRKAEERFAIQSDPETAPLLRDPPNIEDSTTSRTGGYGEAANAPSLRSTTPVQPPPRSKAEEDIITPFLGLNVLEIAAVADAKKFMSQKPVQRMITDIWNGSIVFWDSLNVDTRKRAKRYDKRTANPYSRLRVPKYQKIFEAVFLASLLALYYAVLLEKAPAQVTATEVALYVWLAAFAYDEFGEYRDAGTLFYAVDIWNVTDACIVLIGIAFLVARVIGLAQQDVTILKVSMDNLSLEALLLVPRICALMSLHPFFGTLIPCLKKMSGDFVKFLGIVIILYLGWLTTFTMLGREAYNFRQISWYLVYVFFGSSYLGLDIASDISPTLGPPLMIIFICMTNILLITSLISLLSNTLDKIMEESREQYLFQYSVFVLEASASRRLTYFCPPMNLIPLIFTRPLRLLFSSSQVRAARIAMLKVTHLPYVGAIIFYENLQSTLAGPQNPAPVRSRPGSSARWKRQSGLFASTGQASNFGFTHHNNRSEISIARTPLRARHRYSSAAADTAVDELRWAVAKLTERVEQLNRRMDARSSPPDLDRPPA